MDLQFKIANGFSVQQVLVDEAKLCDASKVILGASRHNAIRYGIPQLFVPEQGIKLGIS